MGVWKKTHAIRWDEETDRKLADLMEAFQPHCRTVTDVVLSSIDTLHAMSMAGTLPKTGSHPPGTNESRYFELMSSDARAAASEAKNGGRVARLEAEVAALKAQFAEFRKQFK
jgi:uncharacterized protein YceH (UPF0502 family)